MPGKMKGRQHRRVQLASSSPEASGLIMDQVKRAPFAAALMNESNHSILMFPVAPVKIVWLSTGLAAHKKLTVHPRTRGCRHGGSSDPSIRHLTFQHPEHLLGSAGAGFRDREQGIGNVQDADRRIQISASCWYTRVGTQVCRCTKRQLGFAASHQFASSGWPSSVDPANSGLSRSEFAASTSANAPATSSPLIFHCQTS